ncbi:uncharacterized protein IWZ02DRAFT_387103 [Phyllosticta citriasiana]|uniref:uncharacterized protein n=1 Tax=Phyllosticta citriasiana TaxID=595635 RepID=UPI0030FD4E94
MSTAAAAPTASPTPPQNTPAPVPADFTTSAAQPEIHTYHCLCAQLLLASTTPLAHLPRRGGPSISADAPPLDRAYILPLPASPPTTTTADDALAQAQTQEATDARSPHYALTLSLSSDRSATIIQRDDGLEKRYLARCGRCRVVVGYWLDWSQFASSTTAADGGRREDVVFLLPGGLLSTEDMAAGKRGEGKVG